MQDLNQPILEESFPVNQVVETQQATTEEQIPLTEDCYDSLQPFERKAVDMRLALLPYKEIKKELKKYFNKDIEEQSIRRWFIEGRPCRTALRYLEHQQYRNDSERKHKAQNRLELTAEDAIGMLGEGLVENNLSELQIKIAQDILDRAGFPKSNKTDVSGKIESESMTTVAQGIKAILERK